MEVTCGFTIPITKYGLPPSLADLLKCMGEIKEAGFDRMEVEIEAGHQEYVDGWDKVIARSKELELDISSAMAVTYELFSLDPAKQAIAIKQFEGICDMVKAAGSRLMTNCFYLPPELKSSDKTPIYLGGPPACIDIPDDFSWPALRQIVVSQLEKMSQLSTDRGLDFAMEIRAGDFVSSVDGLVALFDSCKTDNVGIIYDVAHVHAIKEYMELGLIKFGKKYLKLIHLSDNDGTQAYHYVPGQGNLDFEAIINRLKKIGYDGQVIVDISGVPNILEEAAKMKKMLEGYIG